MFEIGDLVRVAYTEGTGKDDALNSEWLGCVGWVIEDTDCDDYYPVAVRFMSCPEKTNVYTFAEEELELVERPNVQGG